MRISAVETRRYRFPLDPPFNAAWDPAPRHHQEATLVLLHTEEGVTGYGSGDPLLYGPISAVNSPNSNGWSLELNYIPFNYGGPDFWPWLNVKFGLQYVHYNKFDGATSNYDGAGRNAGDNNTIFAYAWFAF